MKYMKPGNRVILIGWVAQVCEKFFISSKAFHLAVYIIDKFLSMHPDIEQKNLQLVAIGSLLIACKFEENLLISTRDLIYISDNAFTLEKLIAMEVLILKALKYDVCVPTSLDFAGIYMKSLKFTAQQRHFVLYILDSFLMQLCNYQLLCSSKAALAILYVLYYTEKTCDSKIMLKAAELTQHPCRFLENNIGIVVKSLSENEEVKKKYSKTRYSSVAKKPILKM